MTKNFCMYIIDLPVGNLKLLIDMRNIRIEEKRREMIFDAAVSCFNERGYSSTKMEAIAAKANISKGGLYHYFKSKKELFLELFNYRVNKYFDQMKSFIKKDDSPEDRIRVFTKQALQIFRNNEEFYKFSIEFLSMGVHDPEIRKLMTDFFKNSVGTFREIIEEGIEKGVFREVDSEKVARSFYFLVMSIFLTYFSVNIDFDIMDQHNFHINNLIEYAREKRK